MNYPLLFKMFRAYLVLRPHGRSSSLRFFSTSAYLAREREHESAAVWRSIQQSKAPNQASPNPTSSETSKVTGVSEKNAPPDLISSASAASHHTGSDSKSTDINGHTKGGRDDRGTTRELDVGELEGAEIRVKPLRRTGEDVNTMRARLLCPFPKTSSGLTSYRD